MQNIYKYNRYKLINHILKQIDTPNTNIVEIGTDEGNFSEFILDNTKYITLYCIDPYVKYENYHDSINNKTGDTLYYKTLYKLKSKFNNRVHIIRKFSEEAAQFIPENINLLYIDGNHQYKYVLNDLELYYNKVKEGGLIIGDDAVDVEEEKRKEDGNIYIEWCQGCFGNYGVVKAFNDYFLNKNNKKIIIGTQYIVFK
jgi:hypothetical protein